MTKLQKKIRAARSRKRTNKGKLAHSLLKIVHPSLARHGNPARIKRTKTGFSVSVPKHKAAKR